MEFLERNKKILKALLVVFLTLLVAVIGIKILIRSPTIDENNNTTTKPFSKESVEYFDKVSNLKKKNKEVIALIKIKGTEINNAVTHTKNNDYYLTKNELKQDSLSGCLFLDCYNLDDFSDSNSVIYGHNMKDNSAFGTLMRFKNKDFLKKNRNIVVYTKDNKMTYKIFSAYITSAKEDYDKVNVTDEEKLTLFKEWGKKSILDFKEDFNKDDKVLTLSTCTYEYNNARFCVKAKLIKEERYVEEFNFVDGISKKDTVKEKKTKDIKDYITEDGKKYKLVGVSYKVGKKKGEIENKVYSINQTVTKNVLNPKSYNDKAKSSIDVNNSTYKGTLGLSNVSYVPVREIKNRTTHLTKTIYNDLAFLDVTTNDTYDEIYMDKITGVKYKVPLKKVKTYATGKKDWVLKGEKKVWSTYYYESKDGLYNLGNTLYSFDEAPAVNSEVKNAIFNSLHLQKKSKYDIYSSRWKSGKLEKVDSNGKKRMYRIAEYTLYEKMSGYKTDYATDFKFPDLTYYDVIATYKTNTKVKVKTDTYIRTAMYMPVRGISEKMPESFLNLIARLIREYFPYFAGVLGIFTLGLSVILFLLGKRKKEDEDDDKEYE